jgi:pentatricopeptide repeat protein
MIMNSKRHRTSYIVSAICILGEYDEAKKYFDEAERLGRVPDL